ncbi:MAG TPA: molybdopterin adenylyltransferase, partial [Bacillota bacterium]|jgi:molybdopterin adenylyltransferase|nr:molybdopterin adenylyltransferase [Bacillota bacterium]HQJ36435.1 molybdopterin adenylyltransferase [Bacillota bacterium]HQL35481.1 molybdopterin adenylyltransferase [Bacillota bacterium]
MEGFSVGIITVSDKGSRGERTDESGPAIEEIMKQIGGRIEKYVIVPDEKRDIKEAIIDMSDMLGLNLILTTGGTGFSKRDVTPEATLEVVERYVPGIPEAMRAKSLQVTPKAMLSRAQAGIRKQSLIINLPGSPKGVRENLEAIIPALKHGIEILTGQASECGGK